MNFKDNLLSHLINPSNQTGDSTLRTVGLVLKIDEENNSCSVKYLNKKGRTVVKKNAPVRLSSSSVIDWFPEKGQKVMIEVNNNSPVVIGEVETESSTSNRGNTTLESDIYSDNMGCETNGGYIY